MRGCLTILAGIGLPLVCLTTAAAGQDVVPQALSKPDQGVFAITCGGDTIVSIVGEGVPCLKVPYCCLHRNDDGGQPKWIETKLVKASFDFQKNTATVEHDTCRLEAVYELKGNRLECAVSIRNTSDADMEFGVRVLDLKTVMDYWNSEGAGFGTSWGFAAPGCKVGVFVQGGHRGEYRKGPADKNGFAPLSVKNTGPREAKHPVVDNRLLGDPGTLLAPGQTAHLKVCLTFAAEGASNAELFTRDYEEMGRKNPMVLAWPDRRPIGTAFIAQSNTGWSGNPRGYVFGLRDKEDIHTEAGLAAFGKRLMEYADRCIVELKDKDAQGVILWDLEGQEKPHCISYVGDPRRLPQAAPEIDRFADAFMRKFSDAGFRTGLTLRPTEYYEPTPGKGDWTHREVRDPVALMSGKIDYAKKRWGTTLFYLDSNVFNQDWGKFPPGANVPWTMPTGMIEKLQKAHPDCLIIPEWSSGDYYRWSAPYSSPNIGQLTTNARDPFARAKWPKAFGVVAVETGIMETNFGTYVDGVAGGDVLLFRCWYHDSTASMVKLIHHEADMSRRLLGKPDRGLSALVADVSAGDESLRYAAAKGLARHKEAEALAAAATLLEDTSLCVRRAALEAIRAQGKVASLSVIERLVAMLKDKDPDRKLLRQGVSEALAAQGEAAVPAARALLESGPEDLRLYAIRCLDEVGVPDPASAKVLLDLFSKPELANNRELREAVILALGKMKVAEAFPSLLGLLEKDEGREREWVRVAAIIALGNLGDKRAIEPLVQEYKHGYSNVQVYVFRWRLYESLTRLTGQKNVVWPSYEGWTKYLKDQAAQGARPDGGGHE